MKSSRQDLKERFILPMSCVSLRFLYRYHRSTARKGKAKDMFPPGRVMFLRPIKVLDRQEKKKEQGVKQQWDAIWITPQELIQEGILVSKKVKTSPERHL